MTLARLVAATIALSAAFSARAFADDPRPAPPSTPAVASETVYLEFAGVDEKEAPALAAALAKVDGVQQFEWTTAQVEAKVVRVTGKADAAALEKAAKGAGADSMLVEPIAEKTMTFVKKLHCPGCVAVVNRSLRAVAGVKDVTVPDTMDTVTVVYDTRKATVKAFEDALAAVERPVVASK